MLLVSISRFVFYVTIESFESNPAMSVLFALAYTCAFLTPQSPFTEYPKILITSSNIMLLEF